MASQMYAALQLLSAANTTSPFTTRTRGFTGIHQAHSFPTDSRGRVTLPTMASLENATTPDDKLVIAGQLADVIKIQADAATQTGLPNRVADMTARSEQVLDAVSAIVDGLKSKDGSVQAGGADPALEPYQKKLARVLGTLHSTLTRISALLPKATKDIAAETNHQIQRLDARAGALASLADLVWKPLPSADGDNNGTATNRPDPTKQIDIFV
ncbi:MAG: hypothetical protein MI741_05205 [Rhodospirillales bacterium]|nr:hypothetical protein [Rhodospirillales bacterium]